jgi:para-aminobenzoate synthetase component 1
MSELPYPFPIRWYGDALDAYAPFADRPGAFMVAINKRYTLIGWQPLATFSATGAFVTMDGRTRIGNPAEALQKFMMPLQKLPCDPYYPFYSGLVGYILPEWNTTNGRTGDHGDLPDAWFGVYDPVVVYDEVEKRLTILSMGLDDAMSPCTVLAEERATVLAQQLVRYNGKVTPLEQREAIAAAKTPFTFMPLDTIQAQCAVPS